MKERKNRPKEQWKKESATAATGKVEAVERERENLKFHLRRDLN